MFFLLDVSYLQVKRIENHTYTKYFGSLMRVGKPYFEGLFSAQPHTDRPLTRTQRLCRDLIGRSL
jgi:hypothetical protein